MNERSETLELDAEGVALGLAAYRVIDVREPHEFHGPLGRIEGSELVPLAQVSDLRPRSRDDRDPLVVCRSGRRSARACEILAANGFRRPTNLAGGMIGWHRAGLPVARTSLRSAGAIAESVVAWSAQIHGRAYALEEEALVDRLRTTGPGFETLDREAVGALIELVEAKLAGKPPADFDLTIGQFRRALASL